MQKIAKQKVNFFGKLKQKFMLYKEKRKAFILG